VCCYVDVSETGHLLVQKSPTECDVSECDVSEWDVSECDVSECDVSECDLENISMKQPMPPRAVEP